MGRWGDSFFADDLALDVKGGFDEAVSHGADPAATAAAILKSELADEILSEFTEDERDEVFWEESSGLIFAAAVIQLENGVLQPETKSLALQAIAAERDMGAEDERLILLAQLEEQLK